MLITLEYTERTGVACPNKQGGICFEKCGGKLSQNNAEGVGLGHLMTILVSAT